MANNLKPVLLRWMKWYLVFFGLVITYILLDFSFNMPSPPVHQLNVPKLNLNEPRLLRGGNILIVVARFEKAMINKITNGGRLEKTARGFQNEQSRIDEHGYFIVLGYGTQVGCPLEIHNAFYRESCSDARYDLLGRSFDPQSYPDLEIPQYTFNHDYSLLTIE